jgi:hypothetical protein
MTLRCASRDALPPSFPEQLLLVCAREGSAPKSTDDLLQHGGLVMHESTDLLLVYAREGPAPHSASDLLQQGTARRIIGKPVGPQVRLADHPGVTEKLIWESRASKNLPK